MEGPLVPVIVFLLVYVAISFELLNKAVASMLGVMFLLVFHVVDEVSAVHYIDFETIMLLLGMMSIVAVLKASNFFTIVSVKISELTKGSPVKILILFSIVTAVLSGMLDNVTTVLIIIPIIIELTSGMGLDPKPFIISQAVISNIGGTATLIGDPPNIIIGSKVGLSFNQFILNLSIPVIIAFCMALFYIWISNKKTFKPINTNLSKLFVAYLLLEKIRFEFLNVKFDHIFLAKSIACTGIAMLLFVTQTVTKITPGAVAVLIAMILFAITKVDVEHMLQEVEWSTLLFFSGLFILVGVLEERGVIEWIAHNVFMRVGDNPYILVLMVLWVSGIVSGFFDNIPFTITMIPIVRLMLETTPIPNNILWWALALGACFGGNFTMIGSSANIVAVGMAKKYNQNVSFIEFMKFSGVITIITLMISSAYLVLYLWISL